MIACRFNRKAVLVHGCEKVETERSPMSQADTSSGG